MAPSRKRKSDEMAEPTTPEASGTPAPKRMKITQMQKQALLDNLQLEITERARHLRAHYALQCADLKARIERRINRIPVSMRTMTMEELIKKHEPAPAPPAKPIVVQKAQQAASRPMRKQKSSIVIAADPIQESANENEDESTTIVRSAPLPKSKATKRPGSRTGKAAGVLSPRSHNSRTLPRSPIKPAPADCQPAQSIVPHSPTKQSHFSARPHSPLKPASPLKSAAIATTSAITSSMHNIISTAKSTATRSGKTAGTRPQNQNRTVSQASTTSTATSTSTGTVVKNMTRAVRSRAGAAAKQLKSAQSGAAPVEKPTAASKSKAGTVKKGAASAAANAKKAAAAASVGPGVEPAASTGRRILRKRN